MVWPPSNIWNDADALAAYYTLYPIPLRPNPGVLILSIVVSILGSYATLLCLGRRTGAQGWRNYALLFASAICFAAVGVWGMHFVSMISMRLQPSPNIVWNLTFSPGMTSLSLFVPLLAVVFAFWFLGDEAEYSIWRLPFAGVFVGLTIGLMHYSASFQLPLHDVSYSAVTVIFALLLACVAATAALYTFFKFRAQWVDSWWRRGLCAVFLAVAVCGMHYLGLGGTSYRVKSGITGQALGNGDHQATRLIIAISVMCGVILLLAIGLFVYDHHAAIRTRTAARHIVIASAAFDEWGRILVKSDGTLPMQVIQTDAEIDRVLAQVDPRNPTFQWLFLLSFNWGLLRPFVRRMYKRMHARSVNPDYADPLNFDVNLDQSWDNLMFRTRFIEAAVCLAQSLDIAVESLGHLFDRILATGTKGKSPEESKEVYERRIEDWASDYGGSVHGITLRIKTSEGVMLFLVRQINEAKPFYHLNESDNDKMASRDTMEGYQARGYRMAEPRFFARAFADRVGVSTAEMEVFLSACRMSAKRGNQQSQKGGIYASIYGIRPSGHGSNNDLEVLVYNFAHHQIPSYRLPEVNGVMSDEQMKWVRKQAGKSIGEVIKASNATVADAEERARRGHTRQAALIDFLGALSVSLEGVLTSLRVWPTLVHDAKLSADIVHSPGESDQDLPVQQIMFELVLPTPEQRFATIEDNGEAMPPIDEHDRNRPDRAPAPFIYTPFSLFCKTQSQVHKGPRYKAHARLTTAELNRLYPPIAEDHADFAYASQNSPMAPGPFKKIQQLWSKDRSASYGNEPAFNPYTPHEKGSPSLSVNTDDTLVKPTNESTLTLQVPRLDEKPIGAGDGNAGRRSRPGTANEVMSKIGQLVRPRQGSFVGQQDEQSSKQKGPPTYAWVRDVHDGWYIRHTEWLEETDPTGMMEGNAWRISAIGPGGM